MAVAIIVQRRGMDDMYEIKLFIKSYQDKNLQGVFVSSYNRIPVTFSNLTRLILLLDDTVRSQGREKWRRKGLKARYHSSVWLLPDQVNFPVLATFGLYNMYRSGYRWMGTIYWVEGRQEAVFRSELELIKRMDDVLSRQKNM